MSIVTGNLKPPFYQPVVTVTEKRRSLSQLAWGREPTGGVGFISWTDGKEMDFVLTLQDDKQQSS